MPFPAGVHDQFNLMISFEGVCELLHTSMVRFRFLVASPPVRGLLLFAKHLFVAANEGKGPGHRRLEQVKQSGIGGYSALPALHQLRRDCRAEHPSVALPTS